MTRTHVHRVTRTHVQGQPIDIGGSRAIETLWKEVSKEVGWKEVRKEEREREEERGGRGGKEGGEERGGG